MSKIAELNPRQRKFLKFYVETGNASKAAQKAGYADHRVHPYDILAKPSFQAAYHELMDKKGLTDEKLLNTLVDGLEATKSISCAVVIRPKSSELSQVPANEHTNDFVDVPDYQTRHKYLETGLKLKKHLDGDTEDAIQKSVINIIRFEGKQNGSKAQSVSGRVSVHRSAVSGNGVSLGNGKKPLRNTEGS